VNGGDSKSDVIEQDKRSQRQEGGAKAGRFVPHELLVIQKQ
jgi:hypothetical protein